MPAWWPYCLRDLKEFILPSVISDLATGGTYNIEDVIDQYLDGQENILHVENELNPMLDAFAYAEDLAEKAVNQLLLAQVRLQLVRSSCTIPR